MNDCKIEKATQAAERMADWYKGRAIPDSITLGCQTLTNPAKYAETALNTLKYSQVLSQHFRAAYNRLYTLKKYLEKK